MQWVTALDLDQWGDSLAARVEFPALIADLRDLIEALASEDVERGIEIRRYNLRGMTSRAMHEGGNQERELAQQYRTWARASQSWPRTADLLIKIAESWNADAERMDSDARLNQMKR